MMNFQDLVWRFYRQHGRRLPWRAGITPYRIFVSEIMLQQTQVIRVRPKFNQFIRVFPDWQSLAQAPFPAVMKQWSGLGYNRRARFIKRSAEIIVQERGGQLPSTVAELSKLPGVGPQSAGAIAAYAFNQPALFIETNIRSVYLHHFFAGRTDIGDRELLPIIARTLDRTKPRQWYWALTDYGAYLKTIQINPSRASRHHVVQPPFAGSRRELRGRILKRLLSAPATPQALAKELQDQRAEAVIEELKAEGFVAIHGRRLQIAQH